MSAKQKRGRRKSKSEPEELDYAAAVQAMESGDQNMKTKVAMLKLPVERKLITMELLHCWKNVWKRYEMGTERDVSRSVTLFRQSKELKNIVGDFFCQNLVGKTIRTGVMIVEWYHWKRSSNAEACIEEQYNIDRTQFELNA